MLVSVTAASGSVPRGAGAMMAVTPDGSSVGTIGGGSVEFEATRHAVRLLAEGRSDSVSYVLSKSDVAGLGMICGGAVNVFFHYIPAGDRETLTIAGKAEELFTDGQDLWLLSDIAQGGKLGLYSEKSGFVGIDAPEWLLPSLSRHPLRTVKDGRDIYAEQINSSGRVYVFGCGHVAQELVPVLSHVGFRCVAMDDRAEFADRKLFPDAEEVLLVDFEKLDRYITVGGEDYACVMTRGHAFDAVVQAQLLKTPACYIGVIGSAAKKAGVYKKLKEEYGFEDADFERITSPIGLSIKAETPAEIAISIAAQMIELRARRNEN